MAGVKSKGGHGGARKGAGRKPKVLKATAGDPVEFLLEVMRDTGADSRLRVRAAIAAAQYRHSKKGDGGKREEQGKAAKNAGEGKFAPPAPPKLVVSNS